MKGAFVFRFLLDGLAFGEGQKLKVPGEEHHVFGNGCAVPYRRFRIRILRHGGEMGIVGVYQHPGGILPVIIRVLIHPGLRFAVEEMIGGQMHPVVIHPQGGGLIGHGQILQRNVAAVDGRLGLRGNLVRRRFRLRCSAASGGKQQGAGEEKDMQF